MSIIYCSEIQNPSKKELYGHHTNFCSSHKGYLQLNFTHNHSFYSAHALGFRPIAVQTYSLLTYQAIDTRLKSIKIVSIYVCTSTVKEFE